MKVLAMFSGGLDSILAIKLIEKQGINVIAINFSSPFHSSNEDKTKQWIFGFSAILIANFILLILPFIRGYCFSGGAGSDLFSHVGYLRPITLSGYISEGNF